MSFSFVKKDTLYFEERNEDVIEILDNNIKDNIIVRAAKVFQEKYHTKGVTIRLEKRIPIEAGLAGGSADASATLRGLNKLYGLNIPLQELEELALVLGSDTVFCLYNKAALCKGRGEILEFIDFDFNIDLCILKPNFGLLTKDVFGVKDTKTVRVDSESIMKALKENDIKKVNELIRNDLYYRAIAIEPKLKNIVDILKQDKDHHSCWFYSRSLLFLSKFDMVYGVSFSYQQGLECDLNNVYILPQTII